MHAVLDGARGGINALELGLSPFGSIAGVDFPTIWLRGSRMAKRACSGTRVNSDQRWKGYWIMSVFTTIVLMELDASFLLSTGI